MQLSLTFIALLPLLMLVKAVPLGAGVAVIESSAYRRGQYRHAGWRCLLKL